MSRGVRRQALVDAERTEEEWDDGRWASPSRLDEREGGDGRMGPYDDRRLTCVLIPLSSAQYVWAARGPSSGETVR